MLMITTMVMMKMMVYVCNFKFVIMLCFYVIMLSMLSVLVHRNVLLCIQCQACSFQQVLFSVSVLCMILSFVHVSWSFDFVLHVLLMMLLSAAASSGSSTGTSRSSGASICSSGRHCVSLSLYVVLHVVVTDRKFAGGLIV